MLIQVPVVTKYLPFEMLNLLRRDEMILFRIEFYCCKDLYSTKTVCALDTSLFKSCISCLRCKEDINASLKYELLLPLI